MTFSQRELLISRIVSGVIRLKVVGSVYYYSTPSRKHRYVSNELYEEFFVRMVEDGVMDEDDLETFLYRQEFWTDKKEEEAKRLSKEMESLKVALYNAGFNRKEQLTTRGKLKIVKKLLGELLSEKHAYDYITCAGIANMKRLRYLVGMGVRKNGKRLWRGEEVWDDTTPLLDDLVREYLANRLDDTQLRELARTEPWRSIWNARKSESSLFGKPVVDLSDEQRQLISWSILYDNVMEHPNHPADEVLEDDDMLDGWIIIQRRNRERGLKQNRANEMLGNDKIRNSSEVFVLTDNDEDAETIDALNDPMAAIIKKQRLEYVKKKGVVNEIEMPDTKLNIEMEMNRRGMIRK